MKSMAARFYPWQDGHRQRLMNQRRKDKLPHAMLLSGPSCLGKADFALAAAALLVCTSPHDDQPCGDCTGCHLFNAGTHPDFRLIEPEDSRQILIDQVRDLVDWINQTAQRGGLKIVVIHPAEQMNANAANALLKCLEEPNGQSLIILVSDLPGRLLPTIRSRCQHISFAMPSTEHALTWLREEHPEITDPELLLEIAGGAPLAVKRQFDGPLLEQRRIVGKLIGEFLTGGDVLASADKLVKADPVLALGVMHGAFSDALRLSLTKSEKYIKNRDIDGLIKVICRNVPVDNLLRSLDAVRRDQLTISGPWNPNPQLLMESLLVEIASLCAL